MMSDKPMFKTVEEARPYAMAVTVFIVVILSLVTALVVKNISAIATALIIAGYWLNENIYIIFGVIATVVLVVGVTTGIYHTVLERLTKTREERQAERERPCVRGGYAD